MVSRNPKDILGCWQCFHKTVFVYICFVCMCTCMCMRCHFNYVCVCTCTRACAKSLHLYPTLCDPMNVCVCACTHACACAKSFQLYPTLCDPMNVCVCVHAKSLQLYPPLCDPMNCSPPGSSVHGVLQAKILERVAMLSLQGIFLTQGSNPHLLSPALAGEFFTTSATGEAQAPAEYASPNQTVSRMI